ncbi:MAG: hypothetical protein U5J64_02620 [Halobacteriales archaeon]|nr:hypothetical protein [Halobacteriales archaeon]
MFDEIDLDDELTVAVAYDGLVELDDVGTALESLRLFADELGVIGNVKQYVVNDMGHKHGLPIDFYATPPGKKNGLMRGRSDDMSADPRYIFLGTGRRDEVLAEKMDWEYYDFYEVAEERGWE